jgi:hypothetical protein
VKNSVEPMMCRRRGRPDFGAQQRADVQLQPDGEQQQRHPQVGDRVECRAAFEAHRIEHEAGGQEAHQRRQSKQLCTKAGEKGQPDHQRFHPILPQRPSGRMKVDATAAARYGGPVPLRRCRDCRQASPAIRR